MRPPVSKPERALISAMNAACRLAMPLSLGVTLLLFLQWPLRDAVGAGSTLANDSAQALFALYVAFAVRHAGIRGTHLVARPDLASLAALPRWRAAGAALCLLPWSVCLAWLSAPSVLQSVLTLERFPETLNPGYFVIKIALLLLTVLLALQSALDLTRALGRHAR
jgi:TRAP-type mannitol/chloroaromatic compound transport system permease small subunit